MYFLNSGVKGLRFHFQCCLPFFCRIRLENEKKKHEDKLERVKEQLDLFKHDCKNKILDISSQVERKVSCEF